MIDNLIVNGIKKFLDAKSINDEFYKYLDFYNNLRELKSVQDIYLKLSQWFENNFAVDYFKVLIHSSYDKKNEVAFESSDVELVSDYEKVYSVDINSELAMNFYFKFKNKKEYDLLLKNDGFINTLFYMTAPLISSVSYQEIVKELAFKDPITESYNRKFLIEHLNIILPLARREKKNVSFLMVGIDHFKAVIDEFDYNIGDKVLVSLAKLLEDCVRESDIVVKLDQDTFLITLVSIAHKEDAMIVANKLIEKFANHEVKVSENGQTLKKTICVGVTHYDYETNSIDDIIKNADISLYEARNLGRSKAKEYKPGDEAIDLF